MSVFTACFNSISKCFYDCYHAPFTKKNLLVGGGCLLGVFAIVLIIVLASGKGSQPAPASGTSILQSTPLIDGCNSFSRNMKKYFQNKLNTASMELNTENAKDFLKNHNCVECQTDIFRMKKGLVGTQIWVVEADCESAKKDSVAQTLEQIDLLKRMVSKYEKDLSFVFTAADIMSAFKQKKIGSMISIRGGHSIDGRIALLRMYYNLGVRSMSLVSSNNSDTCKPSWVTTEGGLSEFGKTVVKEMNRLGMIVDGTGLNEVGINDLLGASAAPVIFSHSNAAAKNSHIDNLADTTLDKLKKDKHLVMLSFSEEQIGTNGAANSSNFESHLSYIKEKLGADKVGIGSNFDRSAKLTTGLEDVSCFVKLFDALLKNKGNVIKGGLNPSQLQQIAGQNFINLFKAVEKASGGGSSSEDLEDKKDFENSPGPACYTDLDIRYPDTKPTAAPTQAPTTTPTSTTTNKKPSDNSTS